jgi:hypothetical protein
VTAFLDDGTYRCPRCGIDRPIYVEYDWPHPCYYDGASEVRCGSCGYREGIWSGRELAGDDHEPPYGRVHRRGCPLAGPNAPPTEE